MPPADAILSEAATRPAPIAPAAVELCGWGGGRPVQVQLLRLHRADEVPAALELIRHRGGGISRGMGRSYGDAAQLARGFVLDTTRLNRSQLDAREGTVIAQAGATLRDLLEATVPAGWMLPVLPGTQHVSVGGAIAGDIHGKSHGVDGTFGAHVEELELLTARGQLMRLTPGDEAFAATLGGMGLTGLILSARIRLRQISNSLLAVDTDRVDGLDQALAALEAPGGRYRVAWLDLLGPSRARGVVTRAEHLEDQAAPPDHQGGPTVPARATVPAWWPGWILRPSAVRAYNELRFRITPRHRRGHVEGIGAHMFPLDALVAWPRLYGPKGFVQYQLVVPRGAERVLERVIDGLRSSSVPCYLAVLKDFGEASGAPLSFPIAGWTLTLDIPRAAPGLNVLLDRFDELVAEAGGRVYLCKDSRMRPDAVAAMYPRLNEWRAARDRLDPERMWRSDLAERTGLLG